jgi:MoaA/NifB/PqqE/SkfB family radical SAM enzyme
MEQQDFRGVRRTLRRLSGLGVRILILEGGEPLLWRDGKKNIRHVIELARSIFPCVCMTTNGTFRWHDLELDRVWVSLDGTPDIHDRIRGTGVFQRVLRHLENYAEDRAFVSTTINTENAHSVPAMISMLRETVAGVTVQFHYPYKGLPDPFFVPHSERATLLDKLIDMKKNGYPVANSVLSLQELKKKRWTCEDGLLANAEPDGKVLHGCYLQNRAPSVCELCGFSAHNEMSLAFRGKWESVMTGMKIFFSRTNDGQENPLESP